MTVAPTIPRSIDDPAVVSYLRSLSMYIEDTVNAKVDRNTANHSVLLASPGGKVYAVRVNDDGTLVTELVAG